MHVSKAEMQWTEAILTPIRAAQSALWGRLDRAFDAARFVAESLPGAETWAAENEGAWTDVTATAASEVPPNLAIEDTEAWFNSGMARWN